MSYHISVSKRNESDTSSSISTATEYINRQSVPLPLPDSDKVVIDIHNTEDICIENIQEEKTLLDYTDDYITRNMNSLATQPPN